MAVPLGSRAPDPPRDAKALASSRPIPAEAPVMRTHSPGRPALLALALCCRNQYPLPNPEHGSELSKLKPPNGVDLRQSDAGDCEEEEAGNLEVSEVIVADGRMAQTGPTWHPSLPRSQRHPACFRARSRQGQAAFGGCCAIDNSCARQHRLCARLGRRNDHSRT